MSQPNSQQGQGLPQGQAARSITVQPHQIQQLVRQCNLEIQQARELGTDTQAGQEHLRKAQRIKNLLMQYQQQQQQNTGNASNANGNNNNSNSSNSNNNNSIPSSGQINQQQFQQQTAPTPQQQQQQIQQPRPLSSNGSQINSNLNARVNTSSPNPLTQNINSNTNNSSQSGSPAPPQGSNLMQQLQQLKQVLGDCTKKLKIIDDAKKAPNVSSEAMTRLLQQEQVWKDRFTNYKTAALTLTQQIGRLQGQQQQNQGQQQQNRMQATGTPNSQIISSQSFGQVPQSNNFNAQTNQQQNINSNAANNNFQFQQQSQINQIPQTVPNQQIPQTQITKQQSPISTQTPTNFQQQNQISNSQSPALQQKKVIQSNQASRIGTPQPSTEFNQSLKAAGKIGSSASPNTPVTNVNAAARPSDSSSNLTTSGANIYKSSVPSINIPAQLSVKQPVPVTATQNRPSLTGGNGVTAPALTTPAMLKLPPFDLQNDRVLSKRKLSELVKTVGADEGDGETTIDGDVEELLLDLADEFVTNITGFACRLAKHRKSESLEAKDIQLHLEKNWNIRIPGFSSDEIRSVRKWPANSAHTQRIQGIGISKSVDQNK